MNALKTHKTEYFPQPVSSWVFFSFGFIANCFPQHHKRQSLNPLFAFLLQFCQFSFLSFCLIIAPFFLYLYSLAFEIFRRKKKETNTLSLTCHVLLNNKSTVHLAIVNGKVEQNTTALTSSKENAIKQGKWMCKKRVFILLRWPAIDTGRNVSLTTE